SSPCTGGPAALVAPRLESNRSFNRAHGFQDLAPPEGWRCCDCTAMECSDTFAPEEKFPALWTPACGVGLLKGRKATSSAIFSLRPNFGSRFSAFMRYRLCAFFAAPRLVPTAKKRINVIGRLPLLLPPRYSDPVRIVRGSVRDP